MSHAETILRAVRAPAPRHEVFAILGRLVGGRGGRFGTELATDYIRALEWIHGIPGHGIPNGERLLLQRREWERT